MKELKIYLTLPVMLLKLDPLFPKRLRKVDKRVELDKELLDIFKKVEINLP